MPVVCCVLAVEMIVHDHNNCMRTTKAGSTYKTKFVYHLPKDGLPISQTTPIRCVTRNALIAFVQCRAGHCTRPAIALKIAVCIGAASFSASDSPLQYDRSFFFSPKKLVFFLLLYSS